MSKFWGCYCVNKSKKAKFWNEEIFSFVPQCIPEISGWRPCWQTNSSKLEWVNDWWIKHVNPPIDNQVLLFHGISEKSVILHEEITLSQADTGSILGSAETHFTISIILHVPLKGMLLWRWARRLRVDFQSFNFSETVRRKWLEGQTLSEGVVDTAWPQQCEFSNLQTSTITFQLEFLCWPELDFYYASCAAHAETWK